MTPPGWGWVGAPPATLTPLDLALWRARSLVESGTWYTWGGDDPSGFDCSGLVIECLKTGGRWARGRDATAAMLATLFIETDAPRPGVLVFWGTPITHVEMVLCVIGDKVFTVGASGGGSKTRTRDDAIRQNAFVKVRAARPGVVKMVDPFVDQA